jgi:hypothetical protein
VKRTAVVLVWPRIPSCSYISQRIIYYNSLFFGRKNGRKFWVNPLFQHREREYSKLKIYGRNLKKVTNIVRMTPDTHLRSIIVERTLNTITHNDALILVIVTCLHIGWCCAFRANTSLSPKVHSRFSCSGLYAKTRLRPNTSLLVSLSPYVHASLSCSTVYARTRLRANNSLLVSLSPYIHASLSCSGVYARPRFRANTLLP